jgi:hypothetical protein
LSVISKNACSWWAGIKQVIASSVIILPKNTIISILGLIISLISVIFTKDRVSCSVVVLPKYSCTRIGGIISCKSIIVLIVLTKWWIIWLISLTKNIISSRIISRGIIADWIYFNTKILLFPKTFPAAVLLLAPKTLFAGGWPNGELFWAPPKILPGPLLLNIEKIIWEFMYLSFHLNSSIDMNSLFNFEIGL